MLLCIDTTISQDRGAAMASTIEWTDETWNPVTGCSRVSPGCDNCYMFSLYPRLRGMKVPGYDKAPQVVQIFPERLELPLTWKKPRRVFVNSMADLFHPSVPFDFISDAFAVMEEAGTENGHTFQVLTKRPGRALAWWQEHAASFPAGWPACIWMGTSVENQKYAARLTVLSRIPAEVRFVSAEPLLGNLDIRPWLEERTVSWVIAGGESGPRARPMHLDWARNLRDQAQAAGVPFFFKQLGGRRSKRAGSAALLDNQLWHQFPHLEEPTDMPPTETVWPLDEHTRGKHLVLKRYMGAWLPIMSKWNDTVLFIDGFAGPGEYSKGEFGSPLIALKTLADHAYKDKMNGDIHFIFIEEQQDRATHLSDLISARQFDLPPRTEYQVVTNSFEDAMRPVLDEIDEGIRSLPPSFIMIDPFGVKGFRMATLQRLLENQKTEVYVSFMYSFINRFLERPEFEQPLDDLYGTTKWRNAPDSASDSDARKNFLFDLFKRQLKVAGANHVIHFELYRNSQLIYAIFFASGSLEGCDKMKSAIWSATEGSPFRFYGDQAQQMLLGSDFTESIHLPRFEEQIHEVFGDRDEVSIEEIIDFAKSDATIFHSGQLKRKTLNPMENKGELKVIRSPRKRKGSYPDGTVLRFLPRS